MLSRTNTIIIKTDSDNMVIMGNNGDDVSLIPRSERESESNSSSSKEAPASQPAKKKSALLVIVCRMIAEEDLHTKAIGKSF